MTIKDDLAAFARSSIGPVDGYYLRPWACAGDPTEARVFLVGANPATPFPTEMVLGSDLLDALLAPDGRLIERIYARLRPRPSPSRQNIEMVVGRLRAGGIQPVLETNVWSLPTRRLSELRRTGRTIPDGLRSPLPDLVRILQPAVVIVHGAAARKGVENVLKVRLPSPAPIAGLPARALIGSVTVFTLPSLSPPAANTWLPDPRATQHLDHLVRLVANAVASSGPPSAAS